MERDFGGMEVIVFFFFWGGGECVYLVWFRYVSFLFSVFCFRFSLVFLGVFFFFEVSLVVFCFYVLCLAFFCFLCFFLLWRRGGFVVFFLLFFQKSIGFFVAGGFEKWFLACLFLIRAVRLVFVQKATAFAQPLLDRHFQCSDTWSLVFFARFLF